MEGGKTGKQAKQRSRGEFSLLVRYGPRRAFLQRTRTDERKAEAPSSGLRRGFVSTRGAQHPSYTFYRRRVGRRQGFGSLFFSLAASVSSFSKMAALESPGGGRRRSSPHGQPAKSPALSFHTRPREGRRPPETRGGVVPASGTLAKMVAARPVRRQRPLPRWRRRLPARVSPILWKMSEQRRLPAVRTRPEGRVAAAERRGRDRDEVELRQPPPPSGAGKRCHLWGRKSYLSKP